MRKFGLTSLAVIAMLLLSASATLAHKDDRGGGNGGHGGGHGHHDGDHRGHGHGHGHGNGGGGTTVTYTVTASNAPPGGAIKLHADVTNADTSVPLAVSVVVHFAAVNVPLDLTVTTGTNAFAADGSVGVGGEEPTGSVAVDFTFTAGGVVTTQSVVAQVSWQ